jgi:hypothetical protein
MAAEGLQRSKWAQSRLTAFGNPSTKPDIDVAWA